MLHAQADNTRDTVNNNIKIYQFNNLNMGIRAISTNYKILMILKCNIKLTFLRFSQKLLE